MTDAERNKLIEDNLDLVWYTMSRYYPTTLNSPDREDFFQIGCVGLIFAAQNYDPGTSEFSTYAVAVIRGRLREEFQKRYRKCRAANVVSLDEPLSVTDMEDEPITRFIPDSRFDPENGFYDLEKFIAILTPPQKTVMYYLLDGMTVVEMHDALHCSVQNVRQKVDRIRCLFADFCDHPEWYNGKLNPRKQGRPRKENSNAKN